MLSIREDRKYDYNIGVAPVTNTIIAGNSFHINGYRSGVDVSFPVMPVVRFPLPDSHLRCNKTKYLATFKGSVSHKVSKRMLLFLYWRPLGVV